MNFLRLDLKSGIRSEKKAKNKIILTPQEDSQAFELIVGICLSLEEAFPFPVTTPPLSIATPDGNLRYSGSGKVSFRNYIIKESEALHTIQLEDAI